MKAILCMMLVLSQMITACNREPQVPMAQSGISTQQTLSQFDSRIQPPDLSKYKDVRDEKDWQNPYLVIRAEGVEVILKNTHANQE